jgi:hypothetical protein
MFDRITLLARGNVIYSGKVSSAEEYFGSLGHAFPQHMNPADFVIDESSIDYRSPEAEEASTARVNALITAWQEHETHVLSLIPSTAPLEARLTSASAAAEPSLGEEIQGAAKPPLWRQISVLTRRTFKTTYRDPMGLSGCLAEAIVMGVIAGWIFYQIDGSLSGIRSRQAALYMAASLQGYLILLFETYRLCEVDIRVFDREHGEGVVGVFAFLISRRLAKFFTEDVPVPFLFSVKYYNPNENCGLLTCV